METECWQAADGKILAMGLTTNPDTDVLVTGGNNRLISFWNAEAQHHASIASSVRNNGRHSLAIWRKFRSH